MYGKSWPKILDGTIIMTRYHGITGDTYTEIILDSGVIYYDFTDLDNPGAILGATRGGAIFIRKPKYVETPYEGITGKVIGSKHLIGVEVSLEVNIISLTDDNIPLAIPNSTSNSSGGYVTISEELWNSEDVHVLDNIALVAERANGGDPIIIILQNPICESDFKLPFKDKNEVISKWKFTAYYAADSLDTAPWSIGIPILAIGMFVAVGYGSVQNYSTDGLTWSVGSMPASISWKWTTYGNAIFIAIARNTQTMAYSTDGINWLSSLMPAVRDWYQSTFGNGTFVAVARNTTYGAYSTDGITWATCTLPVSANWITVTWGNGLFIAFNSTTGAYCASSPDGITWTQRTLPIPAYYRCAAYGNGIYVALISGNTYMVSSTDGINWTGAVRMPSSAAWSAVIFANGIFVAVSYGSTAGAYSSDGLTWSSMTMPSGRGWQDLAYDGNYFIAVAFATTVRAYSTDGINWSESSAMSNVNWESVAYG